MITQTSNTVIHAGTASHDLPYIVPFRFDHSSWLEVTLTPAGAAGPIPLEEGIHYSLSTHPGGQRILHITEEIPAPGVDDRITISRRTPPLQNLQISPAATLPEEDLEDALDRLTLAVQDRDLTRDGVFTKPLRFPLEEAVAFTSQPMLPDDSLRKGGKTLTFNATTGLNELGDFNVISTSATAQAHVKVVAKGNSEKTALLADLTTLKDALVQTVTPRFTDYNAALGGAMKIKRLGGDSGGNGSVTIQTSRASNSQLAKGLGSTAIGPGSSAPGNHTLAFGYQASAQGTSSTAIGYGASTSGVESLAVGQNAIAAGLRSAAFGYGAISQGENSAAYGPQAHARGKITMAIGLLAQTDGLSNTAIGCRADSAIPTGTISYTNLNYGYPTPPPPTPLPNPIKHLGFGISFGYGASIQSHGASAMGASAHAGAVQSAAFGYSAQAVAGEATAIAARAVANAISATTIGADARAGEKGSTAIGMGSAANSGGDTATGKGATATGAISGFLPATALGHEAAATAGAATAIGERASATAGKSVAIGLGARTSVVKSIDLRATDEEHGTASRIYVSGTINAISHTPTLPYADSSLWGEEPAEALPPGMLTFRFNPADAAYLYIDLCKPTGVIVTSKVAFD